MIGYVGAYLKLGWQPIPVHYAVGGTCSCKLGPKCPTPGKHPVPSGWQEKQFDLPKLSTYWAEKANYNIGLVTGARTNLVAFDVDKQHDGYISFDRLIKQFEPLPETVVSETGGGGLHYLFQFPEDVVIPTRGSICPGIDIRGNGGQIVAPPSYHNSGSRYIWKKGHSPSDLPVASMPSWLCDILSTKEPEWRDAAVTEPSEHYIENGRNNALFSLGRRLRYISDINETELSQMLAMLNQSKCRPPLDDTEMGRVVTNVLRKKPSQTIISPEVAAPLRIELLDTKALLAGEVKPLDYLIPNMLIRGEVSLLAAPTEAGKSLINLQMAIAVACGVPALGRGETCRPAKVVYCTEELARRTLQVRLKKLSSGLDVDPDLIAENLTIIPQQGLSLVLGKKGDRSLGIFQETMAKINPKYVVLDTFVAYNSLGEKDPDGCRDWYNAVVLPIRNAYECAFTVQHHTKKPQQENGKKVHYSKMDDVELNHNIRGTSDLPGVSERIWFLWRRHEERTEWGPKLTLVLRNTKAREGDKHDPMELSVFDLDPGTTCIKSVVGEKSARFKEIEMILRTILARGERKTKSTIIKAMEKEGIPRGTVYRWLDKYLDNRMLLSEGEGEEKVLWFNPDESTL